MSGLPSGQPILLKASDEKVNAYLHESVVRRVWAVLHNEAEITVFSPVCPHGGRKSQLGPVQQTIRVPLSRQRFFDNGGSPRRPPPLAAGHPPLENRTGYPLREVGTVRSGHTS